MSSKQVKKWGFVCDECQWIPERGKPDDWVRTGRISKRTGQRGWMPLHYPHRCKSCNTQQRSYQRMRKRLDKIWEISFEHGRKYSRPKLITFALPSEPTTESEGETELKKLNRLLPKARKILEENGVKGGTFVLEETTRLVWTDLAKEEQMWKHHAHVHMVAIAPFIHRSKLKEFCEQLMPIGLGRINYEAPGGDWREAKKRIASYIAKYLVKDTRNSRTWGIMRSNPQKASRSPNRKCR